MQTPDSTAPVVAITRAVPGAPNVPGADVRVLGVDAPDRRDVLNFVRDARVLVSMFSDRVDAELLDAAGSQLRGVCNFAVGYNNVDVDACRQRGVIVTNTPDAVTEGTADMAWLLALAAARRLIEADRFARTGQWIEHGPLGMGEFNGLDFTGRTLLIVGAGRIGLAVARRAQGWGMRTLYVSRSRKWEFELAPLAARRVSLEEGLPEADLVSIHTPLTAETRHLIGPVQLGLMKPTAILVNTSRGPVVDEAALASALGERRIFAAGLDVFEEEPRIHPLLRELDNVVLSPHIGSAERRYREEMTAMVCRNAAAILAGEPPPNRVDG